MRSLFDANGQPITPDIEDLIGGLTVTPAEFNVVITPWSEQQVEIIKREWKYCEEVLLDSETKQWKKVPENMKFSTYDSEANVDA